jgi:hypothetical protein
MPNTPSIDLRNRVTFRHDNCDKSQCGGRRGRCGYHPGRGGNSDKPVQSNRQSSGVF